MKFRPLIITLPLLVLLSVDALAQDESCLLSALLSTLGEKKEAFMLNAKLKGQRVAITPRSYLARKRDSIQKVRMLLATRQHDEFDIIPDGKVCDGEFANKLASKISKTILDSVENNSLTSDEVVSLLTKTYGEKGPSSRAYRERVFLDELNKLKEMSIGEFYLTFTKSIKRPITFINEKLIPQEGSPWRPLKNYRVRAAKRKEKYYSLLRERIEENLLQPSNSDAYSKQTLLGIKNALKGETSSGETLETLQEQVKSFFRPLEQEVFSDYDFEFQTPPHQLDLTPVQWERALEILSSYKEELREKSGHYYNRTKLHLTQDYFDYIDSLPLRERSAAIEQIRYLFDHDLINEYTTYRNPISFSYDKYKNKRPNYIHDFMGMEKTNAPLAMIDGHLSPNGSIKLNKELPITPYHYWMALDSKASSIKEAMTNARKKLISIFRKKEGSDVDKQAELRKKKYELRKKRFRKLIYECRSSRRNKISSTSSKDFVKAFMLAGMGITVANYAINNTKTYDEMDQVFFRRLGWEVGSNLIISLMVGRILSNGTDTKTVQYLKNYGLNRGFQFTVYKNINGHSFYGAIVGSKEVIMTKKLLSILNDPKEHQWIIRIAEKIEKVEKYSQTQKDINLQSLSPKLREKLRSAMRKEHEVYGELATQDEIDHLIAIYAMALADLMAEEEVKNGEKMFKFNAAYALASTLKSTFVSPYFFTLMCINRSNSAFTRTYMPALMILADQGASSYLYYKIRNEALGI